jgi:hypothetical protein
MLPPNSCAVIAAPRPLTALQSPSRPGVTFIPVRSDIGAGHAAAPAHHARREGRNRGVIGIGVDVQRGFVVARIAVDPQRPYAVGAHVSQVHLAARSNALACRPPDRLGTLVVALSVVERFAYW